MSMAVDVWESRRNLSESILNFQRLMDVSLIDFNLFFFLLSELTSRDSELQKLNAEIARAKELDKLVQRQTFELEQLKQQLTDQQNNHADENKIEIRNLQNALDSSTKELDATRALVSDLKVKLDDLNKQLVESKQLTNSKASGDSFLVGF